MTDKFPTPPAPLPDDYFTAAEQKALDADEAFIQAEEDWLDKQKERKPPTRTVEPRTLRTKEAAQYLAISEWKLRALVHAGEITFLPGKYWRFATNDLDKWIEQGREKRQL
jgi:excisionase family DNA binding protein